MNPDDPQETLPAGLKNLATSLNNLNLQTLRRKSLHQRHDYLSSDDNDHPSPVKTEQQDPDPKLVTTTPRQPIHDPLTPGHIASSALKNPIISTPGVSAPPLHPHSAVTASATTARRVPSDDPRTQTRDASLRRELEQVRQANLALSVVLSAVRISQTNLDGVLTAAHNADRLLDSWVAVLSQSQHTYSLLSDAGYWTGVHDDLAREEAQKAEREAAAAAAAAAAEQERRERQKKQQEEEARRRREEAEKAEAATRAQHEQDSRRRLRRTRPDQQNGVTRSLSARRRTIVAPTAASATAAEDTRLRRRGTMIGTTTTPSSATRRPPPGSRAQPGSSIPSRTGRFNPK
ncbi:uncharacterized protein SAPINGB_P003204 [Magnusiomyces paraingens]|uniref:DASH complex subunit DUO1 n=1 Tax=Magnusiomyces paraingens TaxID=2606893 RepID=A0A5E8BKG0_9ASCO|nr:uncharacterized protein SAPINGB_P003204 [Saprochaete ingens]VVT51761.1 unnamed protein product [Saprochaete ingens]